MLDTLIRGGWLADGTGNPLYQSDLAIEGDRIVEVARLDGAEARTVVDASGKVVCPGFVDINGHSDYSFHTNPGFESTIRQGVTTEIVGNCGNGFAPVSELSRGFVSARLAEFAYEGPVEWTSYASYLEAVAALRPACNLAFMVGHNALRYAAGVGNAPLGEDHARVMESFVREAMEAGAYGMSTGLEFEPGRRAATEEIIALNKVVGEYDGVYASHTRNRDSGLLGSVAEFLTIVREGKTRGQHLHLNVRDNTGAPVDGWQRAVELLEEARTAGLDVLTDTTPYRFGTGMMAGILPNWLFEGGVGPALERLGDESVRQRLRGDCDRYWRFIHKGQWERVRLQGSPQFPELDGLTFDEIAARWGKDPWDCYFDILLASGPKMESMQLIGMLFTDEHLAEMIAHPLFCLSADTFSSDIEGPLAGVLRHPIPYGGHVRFLTHHVGERRTLRLEEAIRKMTSMPASRYGLAGRGILRPGAAADVVVFDSKRLAENSTLEQPLAYATGVEWVFVNGTAAIADSHRRPERSGRILRHVG
ncbi:MAG TPA: amidohydrolase family protein [Acidimicrobiales bacterium]|nr:amidohydrolase family protein [Acidimicrobiales bacterium]